MLSVLIGAIAAALTVLAMQVPYWRGRRVRTAEHITADVLTGAAIGIVTALMAATLA